MNPSFSFLSNQWGIEFIFQNGLKARAVFLPSRVFVTVWFCHNKKNNRWTRIVSKDAECRDADDFAKELYELQDLDNDHAKYFINQQKQLDKEKAK